MSSPIIRLYRDFRKAGYGALSAWRSAQTVAGFREHEWDEHSAPKRGDVRLRCEPEEEGYLDVYGEPEAYTDRHGRRVSEEKAKEELVDLLDRLGVWWTCSEVFDGDEWEHVDSCGMHAGYEDASDPLENNYVVDEMRAALKARRDLLLKEEFCAYNV